MFLRLLANIPDQSLRAAFQLANPLSTIQEKKEHRVMKVTNDHSSKRHRVSPHREAAFSS